MQLSCHNLNVIYGSNECYWTAWDWAYVGIYFYSFFSTVFYWMSKIDMTFLKRPDSSFKSYFHILVFPTLLQLPCQTVPGLTIGGAYF
jgi:hypothetical protein